MDVVHDLFFSISGFFLGLPCGMLFGQRPRGRREYSTK